MDAEFQEGLTKRARGFGTNYGASVWGVVASDAKVCLLVAAIVGDEQRWTHLMKLNLRTLTLVHGTWTTLELTRGLCEIAENGKFWRYHARRAGNASRGTGRLFPHDTGGLTIARVPWLAALTDVEQCGVKCGSAIPGDAALSQASQQKLHALFGPRLAMLDDTQRGSFFQFQIDALQKEPEEETATRRALKVEWMWTDGKSLTVMSTGSQSSVPGMVRVLKRGNVVFEFDYRSLRPAPQPPPREALGEVSEAEFRTQG